jgi:hypothetical protein
LKKSAARKDVWCHFDAAARSYLAQDDLVRRPNREIKTYLLSTARTYQLLAN